MPYDFVVGTRDGTTAHDELSTHIVQLLERRGYKVGVNEPFKGVELVRKFGSPSLGRHSVQLEINKRLYMDELSCEVHDGFARTQATIDELIAALQTVHQRLEALRP